MDSLALTTWNGVFIRNMHVLMSNALHANLLPNAKRKKNENAILACRWFVWYMNDYLTNDVSWFRVVCVYFLYSFFLMKNYLGLGSSHFFETGLRILQVTFLTGSDLWEKEEKQNMQFFFFLPNIKIVEFILMLVKKAFC